jgi:hypothetical protein
LPAKLLSVIDFAIFLHITKIQTNILTFLSTFTYLIVSHHRIRQITANYKNKRRRDGSNFSAARRAIGAGL